MTVTAPALVHERRGPALSSGLAAKGLPLPAVLKNPLVDEPIRKRWIILPTINIGAHTMEIDDLSGDHATSVSSCSAKRVTIRHAITGHDHPPGQPLSLARC